MIYAKLKVYYEGLVKNTDFFRQNLHNIDEAIDVSLMGKYNHTSERQRKLVSTMVGEAK